MSNKLFFLSLILFVLISMFVFLVPSGDAQWFYDFYGYVMVGCIHICMISALLFLMLFNGNQATALASAITGVGLILFGFWSCGEKQRFAALDVLPSTAIIDKFDGLRRRSTLEVYYHYTNSAGAVYYGTDTVNSGATAIAMKVGGEWPIHILRSDYAVSRIVEENDWQIWLFKGVFIVTGVLLLVYMPFRMQKKTSL